MRSRSRFVWFTLFLLYFGVVAVPNANAYIDPGSGSLLIQVLIASILAVPYFLRTQVSRAIAAIRGKGHESSRQDEATTVETP